jgi:hypothetical protein
VTHKEADEPHDHEAQGRADGDLVELCTGIVRGESGADCNHEQRGHRTSMPAKLQVQRYLCQTSSVWLRAPLDEPYAVLAKLLQGRDHIVHGCECNKASAAGYTPRRCQQQLLQPVQRGLRELLCRMGLVPYSQSAGRKASHTSTPSSLVALCPSCSLCFLLADAKYACACNQRPLGSGRLRLRGTGTAQP